MDIKELLQHLKRIKCWTPANSMARNLISELIQRLEQTTG